MNAEVLPADVIAAQRLLEQVLAVQPNAQAIDPGEIAQHLANHRQATSPGPLAWKLEAAYSALLFAGCPDDELLKRLKAARDSARNLGKAAAA